MASAIMFSSPSEPACWLIHHPAISIRERNRSSSPEPTEEDFLRDCVRVSDSNPYRLTLEGARMYLRGAKLDGGGPYAEGPFQKDVMACLQRDLGLSYDDALLLTSSWALQAQYCADQEFNDRRTDRLLASGCCNDILDGVLK